MLQRPIQGLTRNASGLTFNTETGTLFTVINRPAQIAELTTDGRLLRVIPLDRANPRGVVEQAVQLIGLPEAELTLAHATVACATAPKSNAVYRAIAAAKAGAAEVVACDLDPLALAASRANAALNGVTLNYSDDFFAEADRYDLILVADVLYDRANLPLLDHFLSRGKQALVADSRVKDFQHPRYQRLHMLKACTWPDLAEPQEFRQVSLYHAQRH